MAQDTYAVTAVGKIAFSLTRADAESISFGLSDLLCWAAGFKAGRSDDLTSHPMGCDEARELNHILKRALSAPASEEPDDHRKAHHLSNACREYEQALDEMKRNLQFSAASHIELARAHVRHAEASDV